MGVCGIGVDGVRRVIPLVASETTSFGSGMGLLASSGVRWRGSIAVELVAAEVTEWDCWLDRYIWRRT
ncbi:hypothetical protein PM082_013460 [Marasmius tenuissimus]|nr:hypothetical protein PM082_013460 [Marasmius tenuissimus]